MTTCPFCVWSDKSYRLPHHLITHHIKHIQLAQGNTGHCVKAYYRSGAETVEFCVCLTCHKGTMDNGSTGNGARWFTLHSKKTECVAAHPQALRDLYDRMTRSSAPHVSTPSSRQDSVQELWSQLREHPKFGPILIYIEKRRKAIYEHDSANDPDKYVFNPTDGFRDCIYMTYRYHKETHILKEEIPTLRTEMEQRDAEFRMLFSGLVENVKALEDNEAVLTELIKTLKDRVKVFEDEHTLLKEHVKTVEDEHTLLKEHVKTVEDKHKLLNGHVKTVEDENNLLKEHVKTIEDKHKLLNGHVKTVEDENKQLKEENKLLKDKNKLLKIRIGSLENDK